MLDEHGIVIDEGTLRFSRKLEGPIERVWDWLTLPEHRVKWLAAGPMELKPGGQVELLFDHSKMECPPDNPPERYADMDPEQSKSVGEITVWDPPHVLAYTWIEGDEGSEVTFDLSEEEGKVRLVLTHRKLGDNIDILAGVAAGWHTHTGILEDLLAGRKAKPFWAVHVPLEDRLREKLKGEG